MSEESIFGGMDLNSYVEPQVFGDGVQVRMRVLDAELKTGVGKDSGKDWANLQLVLSPINYDALEDKDGNAMVNPKVVYFPIWLPTKESTPQQVNRSKGALKRVYDAIGEYPEAGVPKREDFLGKELEVVLKLDTSQEEPKNEVRRLIKAE